MTSKKKDRVSAVEALRIEAHQRVTDAQRALSESPHDRAARARYALALQDLREAEERRESSPPVRPEFARVAPMPEEPKPEKPAPALRPPEVVPTPLGDEAVRGPQVSPYLRDSKAERESLQEEMKLRREFQRAARDVDDRER